MNSAASTMTSSRRIMINTVLNIGTQVITVAINFLLIRFFLERIGEEQYGVWILVGSIFSYRSMLTMGLNSAVNRHIPVFAARGDDDGTARVISTGFAFHLALAAILAIATLVLAVAFERFFAVPSSLIGTARTLVLVVGFSFAAAISGQHFQAVLSGYQRDDIINYTTLTAFIVRTIVVVALLLSDFGLIAMGVCYGLAEIAMRFLPAIYASRLTGHEVLTLRAVDWTLMREMVGYGVNSSLYNSGAALAFKSADVLIASLIAASAVPRFFITATPILVLITLVQMLVRAIKPAISDLDARSDTARIEELALLSQKYTLILILPSVAFLVVMGHSFLTVWVGGQYPDPSTLEELASVMTILAVGTGVQLTQYSNFMVLVGKGEHRIYGMMALASTVGSIVLGVLAIRVADLGLEGMAWACSLPMLIGAGGILPIYFKRRLDIAWRDTLQRSWLPAIASCTPGVLLLVFWESYAAPRSWPSLAACVITVAALTAVASWTIGMSRIERNRFMNVARLRRR